MPAIPDATGYGKQLERIVRVWRSTLVARVSVDPSSGREDKEEE
jgi:hypothetical protein